MNQKEFFDELQYDYDSFVIGKITKAEYLTRIHNLLDNCVVSGFIDELRNGCVLSELRMFQRASIEKEAELQNYISDLDVERAEHHKRIEELEAKVIDLEKEITQLMSTPD